MIKIALTNLAQYNEGILNYTWLSLPATQEEINAAFDKIQVTNDNNEYFDAFGSPYEEWFITDFECDYYKVDEYENLDDLNEMAEEIEALDDYEQDIVKALINEGYTIEEALDAKDDCIYYSGCDSMAEVAEQYAEETGLLDSIPENLRYYFDFEAFGRDMDLEGNFIATDDGYIEVIR